MASQPQSNVYSPSGQEAYYSTQNNYKHYNVASAQQVDPFAQNQNIINMQNNYTTHLQNQQLGTNRIYQRNNDNAYSTQKTQNSHDTCNQMIPSSHQSNGTVQERDKTIYRCFTMRPSTGNMVRCGQYSSGQSSFASKPAILSCPLPQIPIDNCDLNNKEKVQYSISRLVFY